MKVEDVQDRIKLIEAIKGDNEVAHIQEDALYIKVLEAIASSETSDPSELCRIALKCREVEFSRWYA